MVAIFSACGRNPTWLKTALGGAEAPSAQSLMSKSGSVAEIAVSPRDLITSRRFMAPILRDSDAWRARVLRFRIARGGPWSLCASWGVGPRRVELFSLDSRLNQ